MNKNKLLRITATLLGAVLLLGAGIGIGWFLRPAQSDQPTKPQPEQPAVNLAYEQLKAAAAWQLSAEAHALMLQGFHLATNNIDAMAALADAGQQGYHWVDEKLYLNDKRVAVVCDIDDTLVDGVHYTANILGKNGEWTNKAFTDLIQSRGCTALPGAVAFANHCIDRGVALFYVTNRYDQGYKTSESGYGGQQGYQKPDGTVIGSSTYDIFGKTMYDITMESMAALGFPTNDPQAANYSADAVLIVNDTKLNGSSKEWVRTAITEGGAVKTGQRPQESNAYPDTVELEGHHIAMLLGDDLNDMSQSFSDSANAVDRVALTIENMQKWGTEWIVFPNAVYGSAANFAGQYGYDALFDYFDYTNQESEAWELYQ